MADQTVRTCRRCGQQVHGRQCQRRTCVTLPKCWQHTAIHDGLRVKPSHIQGAGKGLFATREFDRGEKITDYKGDRLTRAQLEHRYPGNQLAQYAVRRTNDLYIDARDTSAGVARYANHAPQARTNAKLADTRPPGGPPGVAIRAKRHIRPNQEVLVNYGRDYWDGRQNRPGAPPAAKRTKRTRRQ